MKKKFLTGLVFIVLVFGFGLFAKSALAANPCVKNPCSAGKAKANTPIRRGLLTDMAKLKAHASKLWRDSSLGTTGLSCNSCHPRGKGLKAGSWPKKIKMAGDILTLDQMINFCMTNPMKARPLMWNSRRLTALVYYVSTHSKGAKTVNPCSGR